MVSEVGKLYQLVSMTGRCRLCLGCVERVGGGALLGALLTLVRRHCHLPVSRGDGLPQHICGSCEVQLRSFAAFYRRCRLIHLRLQNPPSNKPDKHDVKSDQILDNPLFITNECLPTIKKEDNSDDSNDEKCIDTYDGSQNEFQNLQIKNEYSNNRNDIKSDVKSKKKKCASVPPTLCPICGEIFKQSSGLMMHMRRHNGDKRFACTVCGKCFISGTKRKEHELIHQNIKNFPCDICGKKFLTKHASNKHKKLVHFKSQRNDCTVCGKTLSTRSSFATHMKSHTDQRDYECDTCNKKFVSRYSILSHMRVHSGEKPYACSFCDSKFAHNRTLIDHERLHRGEAPHKCPICGKGFAQRGNMKSHYKYNHKDADPIPLHRERINALK